jgi:uncharacterized protein YraI
VAEKPAEPEQPAQSGSIRVTGDEVNIRTGPGTNYDVVKAVKKGVLLMPANTFGWVPILLGGEVCWISKEYSEEISS